MFYLNPGVINDILQGMNEFKDISFYPKYEERVDDKAKQWLTAVNEHLRTEGLTVDVAKGLLINRHALNIPSEIQLGVDHSLSSHYGLTGSDTDDGFGKLNHSMDLAAAVDYERFGIDPLIAIQEYKGTNWQESLSPYAQYQPSSFDIGFRGFAETSRAAVVAKKGNIFTSEAIGKSERIKNMSPKEWEEYRHGTRWSQSARAQEVLREGVSISEKIMEPTRSVYGLSFIKKEMWNEVLKYFLSFRSTQLLDENSHLRKMTVFDFMLGQVHLSIEQLLLPKDQKESK